MLNPMNLENSLSATSSPESAVGHTPSDSQDGPTIDQSGQEAAHANLSARQAKEKGLLTNDTSGLLGSGSLASYALTQFLASKLQQKLGMDGLTLCDMTWKKNLTPSGFVKYALRRSGHRIGAEKEISLWPTPISNDSTGSTHCYSGGNRLKVALKLPGAARVAVHGYQENGRPAKMVENGSLNPELSRWLMGYPKEWGCCGVMAMQSCRKSRQK